MALDVALRDTGSGTSPGESGMARLFCSPRAGCFSAPELLGLV